MVVVVPYSRRPVRISSRDVAVKAKRGRVVEDFPEVGGGVEGLGGDASVAGLEVVELGGELRVERVQVGDERFQRCLRLVVECWSFVEGWSRVVISKKPCTEEAFSSLRIRLTRHCVDNKVSSTILVQVLHQIKVLRQSLVDGAARIVRRLPEALANVIDADPDGNKQVVSCPRSLGRGGDHVLLELANLCNQVRGDTSVDNSIGNISTVIGKVVSKNQRAVELLSHHADPVEPPGGGRAA